MENIKYKATIYDYQYEIENLNEVTNRFNTTLIDHYWLNDSFNEKEPIDEVLVALADDELQREIEAHEPLDLVDEAQRGSIADGLVKTVFGDNVIQLKRIPRSSSLYNWLLDWYGWTEEPLRESLQVEDNLNQFVRCCITTDDYLYYLTGVGRSNTAEDNDLLGGNGDGTASQAFLDFINGRENDDIEKIRRQWL